MFLILLLIWLILSVLSPYFFTVNNLFEITLQSAVFAIIAAGETFVIFSGGIDLSVGSVFAFSSVVGGLVFQSTGSTILTILASILAGIFAGGISGVCITKLKVPPFVATLGMMGIARGFALILCKGIPIYGLTKGYMWLGQGKIFGIIPVPTIIVALIFVIAFLEYGGCFELADSFFVDNLFAAGEFIYTFGITGHRVCQLQYILYRLGKGYFSVIENDYLLQYLRHLVDQVSGDYYRSVIFTVAGYKLAVE